MNYLDVCAAIIAYGVTTILALFVAGVLLVELAVLVSLVLDLWRKESE